MGLEKRNLYHDEWLCLAVVHWSCSQCVSKRTTPSFFALRLCRRMCCSTFPSPRQPVHFLHQGIMLWMRAVCSCMYARVVSAGGFGVSGGPRPFDQAGVFLFNSCLSQDFSLWHFDGVATHLQVHTSFWACASCLLSTCMCHSSDVLCVSTCPILWLTFTGRSRSACFSHSQSGMTSCRTRPQRTLSVLAATCCCTENALTHTGTNRNQRYSSLFK